MYLPSLFWSVPCFIILKCTILHNFEVYLPSLFWSVPYFIILNSNISPESTVIAIFVSAGVRGRGRHFPSSFHRLQHVKQPVFAPLTRPPSAPRAAPVLFLWELKSIDGLTEHMSRQTCLRQFTSVYVRAKNYSRFGETHVTSNLFALISLSSFDSRQLLLLTTSLSNGV